MPTDQSPWGATWYAATMVDAPQRAALAQDVDVDACVIGGGLAGLTTARELARRGWSVAVLEARRVAWNASGRNAGFVAPGFAERLEAIVERVGLRRAKELWALSTGGVDYVRATIRETEMPGVDPVHGRLTVRRTDDEEAVLRLVAMLRVDFGVAAEAWPTEQVREVLRTPLYYQAVHLPAAFHIHALNYALGLASAAERAGARIYEDSPAVALDVLGVRKRIETPNGRVRANHIVLAGGPHLGAVFPPIAGTVVPVASYIATTAPLGERLAAAIQYPGAVADTRRAGDYYRAIGDRLMWGGRITTRVAPPRWLPALMRRDIVRVYPQLADVHIEHAWSGAMSYAVHKMPQIGELSPGVWLAGAFGGHGLNTTAMAGELIARAIVERDDRWRLFSAYELVWAGGKIGPAAGQVLYWSMQVRDAVEERLSHRRDGGTGPGCGGGGAHLRRAVDRRARGAPGRGRARTAGAGRGGVFRGRRTCRAGRRRRERAPGRGGCAACPRGCRAGRPEHGCGVRTGTGAGERGVGTAGDGTGGRDVRRRFARP
jgi:gamma-glutamylputrescine oxidase